MTGEKDTPDNGGELEKKSAEPDLLDLDASDTSDGESRSAMRQMMAFMGFSRSSGGPLVHPVFDKFNDKHVETFLDQSHAAEMERLRQDSRGPIYGLFYLLLVVGLLIFLVVYLSGENRELLEEILKIALAFAGGVGGGYGWRAHQESRRTP